MVWPLHRSTGGGFLSFQLTDRNIFMPSVTINPVAETPSAVIIRNANKTATVSDAHGRVITIRRITPSLRQRLRAIAGPELSRNEQWLGEAALTFAVVSIDGEPVTPNNIRELEVTSDRLDEIGLFAVAQGYVNHFGIMDEPASVDKIKN
jgi:hypothetical protein